VAAREKLELESRKQVVELAPLRSEVIQINYAKAQTLGDMLKSKDVSLLSPRGQVSVDERTNTLLVQDVADKISEVRGVITRLDVPVRQVLIDSRVVIARDDFSRELGVRFGFTGVTTTENGIVSTTGSADGNSLITRSAADNLRQTGQPFPVAIPPLVERLGVNLATVSNPYGRVALAILGQDYLLDLELSALPAEGRGETLSNPRVITTDRQTAFIKQGREIPYQNRTQDGVTTEFRDAVLELQVTPQITPDDRLIMDLNVKKDEQGRDVPSGIEGGFIPTIEKREVATQVLVNNGDTVVLGGVFEQVKNNQVDKVPLLGDIPVLGRLFQRRANMDQKFELLIFVTPQIISDKGIAAR
jgi:type IV pilus assembly protein PilQ